MNVTKPTDLFPEAKRKEIKGDILERIESEFNAIKNVDLTNRDKYSIKLIFRDTTYIHSILNEVCEIYKMAGWDEVKWISNSYALTFRFYVK